MKNELHITYDLLRSASAGEEKLWGPVLVAIAHLTDLCPQCREAFDSIGQEMVAQGKHMKLFYDVQSIRSDSYLPPDWSVEEHAAAAEALAELLAAEPGEREALVREGGDRFTGGPLADALLEEARRHLPAEPREAGRLAALAQAAVEAAGPVESEPGPLAATRARALAHRANALRAVGDLPAAEVLFVEARKAVGRATPDPFTGAELDSLEASLRRAQRRFYEARHLLHRAVICYMMAGRKTDTARALVKLGTILGAQGEPQEELKVLRAALATLDPAREPRLYLMARHNLVDTLCDLGDHETARAELTRHLSFYRRYPDPWSRLRFAWVEGKIARAHGEDGVAEAAFCQARDGFLEEELPYDAALVALDLALVYLGQERCAEIAALAEEALPVFEALGVHREALAAWMLFTDAARRREVTAGFLGELASYLERARDDPSLAFAEPC